MARSLGLSNAWRAGATGYLAVGAIDAWHAARTWHDALVWAAREAHRRGARVASLQAWGHGGFSFTDVGQTRLENDREDFAETHDLCLAGGRADESVRARFPQRFALLDEIFAGA